jgi:hypothetical protein
MPTIALFDASYYVADKISYADVASLKQHEQRIRRLKRTQKKAMAAAKIAALEHAQDGTQIPRQDSGDEHDSDVLYTEFQAKYNDSRVSLEDDYSSGSQDSVLSGTSFGHEDLRESLLSDYEICLGRLNLMQTILKGALRKLDSARAERSTARARQNLVREVDEHGRETLRFLEKHIVKSFSHGRIMRKGDYSARRRSAQTEFLRPVRSDGLIQSGAGK